jgi:hypothetical protein
MKTFLASKHEVDDCDSDVEDPILPIVTLPPPPAPTPAPVVTPPAPAPAPVVTPPAPAPAPIVTPPAPAPTPVVTLPPPAPTPTPVVTLPPPVNTLPPAPVCSPKLNPTYANEKYFYTPTCNNGFVQYGSSVIAGPCIGGFSGNGDFAQPASTDVYLEDLLNNQDTFCGQCWEKIAKVDVGGANDTTTPFKFTIVPNAGDKTNGTWSIDSSTPSQDLVITLKAGNGWAAYFLPKESFKTSGKWYTGFSLNPTGKAHLDLSHSSIWRRKSGFCLSID